jgi:UDP-N-acetyl-D-glucosamine dehydrogenase
VKSLTIRKEITGIIGLGYVGLPLMLDFCEAGLRVIGFDIDESKITKLQNGDSYISYIPAEIIYNYLNDGLFEATGDFSRLGEVDNIIITVPTPLNEHREPELKYVRNTAMVIAQCLKKGQLVVLESTTYPGTSREIILPVLEKTGLKAGQDFFLAYSPERVDPNNKDYRARDITKVIGGLTTECLARAKDLYERVFSQLLPVSSLEAAEASKLLENIFRGVNIALVNELKVLFDRMGIDIWEVIEASSTKPFGFMPFYPGPGLGGHCIPIDPFYLTWKAREYDFSTRFIELAGEINNQMPYYVVQKTMEALNEKGKSIKGAKIILLGAAYKRDVDDIRESPAVKIITLLQSKGAVVSYHDPYVPIIEGMRSYPDLKMKSVELTKEILNKSDCVLVVTDHSCVDYRWILTQSSLVVDTRNALKDLNGNNVSKA